MRSLLIYLSLAGWARKLITGFGPARRVAHRFVAGEVLADAISAIERLNGEGILATLDHLGEHTTRQEDAARATEEVLQALDAIQAARVQSNFSLKLSQLGILLDERLCMENLRTILQQARQHGNFIRIDMEESALVERTLAIYQQLRQEGYANVGVVIQSYLYRSEEDVKNLSVYPARVRLVKGAYLEPPEIAYPNKADVDASFDRLTLQLLQISLDCGIPRLSDDGCTPPIPAIATHDEARIAYAVESAARLRLPKDALEFQMLYGIRRDLQERLVSEEYPVRVYVPYGTEWYPYFMRRLAERPANLWFFLSNLFR
jgi:proline dehydrogenase